MRTLKQSKSIDIELVKMYRLIVALFSKRDIVFYDDYLKLLHMLYEMMTSYSFESFDKMSMHIESMFVCRFTSFIGGSKLLRQMSDIARVGQHQLRL